MTLTPEAPTLPLSEPASLGLDPERIERLCGFIQGQIDQGLYPGAQIAFARHGRLAFVRSFGRGTVRLYTASCWRRARFSRAS